MNVTLKLPDDLCREAEHRAIDESKSLSAWVAGLLEQELKRAGKPKAVAGSLIDKLTLKEAPAWFYEREFPLEDRRAGKVSDFSFGD